MSEEKRVKSGESSISRDSSCSRGSINSSCSSNSRVSSPARTTRIASNGSGAWKRVKLGEITTLFRGSYVTRDSVKPGPIPVILGGNEPAYYCDESNHEGPCLVISRSGASAGFVTFWDEPIFVTDGFLFEAKPGTDIRYLYYCPKSQQRSLAEMQNGAGIPHVRAADLKQRLIPLPPLPVQRHIADILSAYDDKIANNRRRMDLLEETARLLYRKMFGNSEWTMRALKDIACVNERNYSLKTLPSEIDYVDIASVSKGEIKDKTHYTASEAPGRARRIARDGDVIWSNVRPNLRAYALVLSPGANDVFSTGFSVVTAKRVPFTYLYFVLTDARFISYLDGRVTGATYPAVRPTDFEEYDMPVPDDTLLERFHSIVLPMFRQKTSLSHQNTILAEARDLLLPRLMMNRSEVVPEE